ncbi:MAG: hypothetical protein GY711_28255 [bacterium]|nr:hypothetical protein [bacterium]
MRPLLPLLPLLLTACASTPSTPSTPDHETDFATLFSEPHHGFTPGVPAVVSSRDRLENARYSEDGTRLFLDADGGRFTSRILNWPRPFNELLVSWNVDVPEGAGIYVEVQVGREEEGAISPWLYIGDWGRGLPKAERLTEFSAGKVAVDVFQSKQTWNAARYRITALPGGDGAPIAIARTALSFSDTRALDSTPVEARAATREVLVAVPARSQKEEEADIASRVCSPTSVAMVLEHHGVDRPTAQIARTIYDTDHDIYGNWPRAVQAAWTYGVPGDLVRLSSWAAAEAFLARGIPLVISVRAEEGELRGAPYPRTSGHLLVLVGLDAEGNAIVNDPAAESSASVRRTYAREDLEHVWMHKGGVAYAIGPGRPPTQ